MKLAIPVIYVLLLVFFTDFLSLRYISKVFGKKKISLLTRFIISIIFSIAGVIIIYYIKWETDRSSILPYAQLFLIFSILILLYIPRLLLIPFGVLSDVLFFIKNQRVHKSILYFGALTSALMFLFILYGMIWGRDLFQVKNVEIKSAILPKGFNEFKIVQISDLHLGSYGDNTKPLLEAIDIINKLKPDLIVFTGDLVNNYFQELMPFSDIFKQLYKPPFGTFAVLGNHDYSDYSSWENDSLKERNSQLIFRFLEASGFTVLKNKSSFIINENDTLVLAGVDNWGLPPFKQYGDLDQAMQGIDQPTILLSHNPTHWRSEVLGQKNIFLTLSGHTHGMQLGIETENFSWSPVKYMYKEWNGLYYEKDQFLYVNKGLGFIGFAARMGMYPEITLITLKKESRD